MAIQKIYRCIRNDGAEGSPDYAEYIPDLSARALSDAAGRGIEENYVRTEQLRSGVQGMRTLSESGSGDVGGAYTPVYLRNGYLVPATNVMDLVSDQIVGGSKRFEGPVTLAGSTSVTGPSTISGDVALSGCTVDLTGVTLRVNGSRDIGSASNPIYLDGGVPTVATNVMDIDSPQTVTAVKEFTQRQRLFWAGAMANAYYSNGVWYDVFSIPDSTSYIDVLVENTSGHRSMWGINTSSDDPATSWVKCLFTNRTYSAAIGVIRSEGKLIVCFMGHSERNWTLTAWAHDRNSNAVVVSEDGNVRLTDPPTAYVDTVSGGHGEGTLTTWSDVSATDGVTNNLVHNIGNEIINGFKTFLDGIATPTVSPHIVLTVTSQWRNFAKIDIGSYTYAVNFNLRIRRCNPFSMFAGEYWVSVGSGNLEMVQLAHSDGNKRFSLAATRSEGVISLYIKADTDTSYPTDFEISHIIRQDGRAVNCTMRILQEEPADLNRVVSI